MILEHNTMVQSRVSKIKIYNNRNINHALTQGSTEAASGRPRGQRAVVGSASTSVRPRGVHGRRHQARQ